MTSHEELIEWILVFLQNRDIFNRVIAGFERINGDLLVKRSIGDLLVLVRPVLKDVSDAVSSSGPCSLVVLNVKGNLDVVLKNWDSLAKKKDLCIYFVNPASNDKWILYPFTHNQITEKASLRKGLETLFSMVPSV